MEHSQLLEYLKEREKAIKDHLEELNKREQLLKERHTLLLNRMNNLKPDSGQVAYQAKNTSLL